MIGKEKEGYLDSSLFCLRSSSVEVCHVFPFGNPSQKNKKHIECH